MASTLAKLFHFRLETDSGLLYRAGIEVPC